MSQWPTGVSVISSYSYTQDNYHGLTASSFVSLSLDPQLILFCVKATSSTYSAIIEHGKFGVSFLNNSQKEIANICSSNKLDKFASIPYILGKNCSSPLIQEANCWLECSLDNSYEGGDHKIIIGQILAASINNSLPPLLYHSRNYRSLK
ncbi:MAG: flavin reductase family protein [Rickettsiaceae bacterium]|nr:flavin reductase family protein [Rickettsiaceae bacterium]